MCIYIYEICKYLCILIYMSLYIGAMLATSGSGTQGCLLLGGGISLKVVSLHKEWRVYRSLIGGVWKLPTCKWLLQSHCVSRSWPHCQSRWSTSLDSETAEKIGPATCSCLACIPIALLSGLEELKIQLPEKSHKKAKNVRCWRRPSVRASLGGRSS